ncbi:hypothetical protein A2125_02085 [Candidatus Woesebacteria bacterium GWB1_43_5]|uniref:Phosphodiester glycosidase domain-containing protein n=1 Tax=Candidatus Woesebacteria bacterium GWB1_43_5 TaxID=1802474 RepID=A0A1F7WTI6_9BACT|nr:MAG: hypothetical protein A2125_02085 [Candidatus Woesebacteria bacterium GWB1_43_5]
MRSFLKRLRDRLPKRFPLIIAIAAVVVLGLVLGYFGYKRGLLGKMTDSIGQITQQGKEEEKIPEKVKAIQPEVTLVREGKTSVVGEGLEQNLQEGDAIATGPAGVAQFTYPSGTVVRLGPATQVVLTSPDSLGQQIGKVYVRFRKLLGVQEKFEVESTSAIAAVRGSTFASFIKPNVNQRVMVTEDEAEVTPKDAGGNRLEDSKKTVKKGEQASISKTGTVTVSPQKLTTEEKEWLDFNAKLDENPEDLSIINLFSTLKLPTPTPMSVASGSPTPTAVPLFSFTSMPGTGYQKGSVATSIGTFPLACYGANRGSIRMVTDSASDSDCTDNCPVLPLDVYATRNGGVAAINGMYFCPADYPACSGKVNTFDTLFFNSRTKTYMNSANNVYSNIPFVGMNADHSIVFAGSSSSWGRDAGIIGGTAGNPMLMQGGGYAVNEGALDDKQRNVKSNRGAIVLEGDTIYLCITQGATVPDSAKVYQTLGADYAINIDGGGSSALWVQGAYKYGPGRQIPTAIILAP